mmetsp:Transcript_89190/g.238934  ORF Transcript_89190/g.238934 Transcript_89190/m.238934 type:complete len:255 (-) Transcript_89190:672-1436(-)
MVVRLASCSQACSAPPGALTATLLAVSTARVTEVVVFALAVCTVFNWASLAPRAPLVVAASPTTRILVVGRAVADAAIVSAVVAPVVTAEIGKGCPPVETAVIRGLEVVITAPAKSVNPQTYPSGAVTRKLLVSASTTKLRISTASSVSSMTSSASSAPYTPTGCTGPGPNATGTTVPCSGNPAASFSRTLKPDPTDDIDGLRTRSLNPYVRPASQDPIGTVARRMLESKVENALDKAKPKVSAPSCAPPGYLT